MSKSKMRLVNITAYLEQVNDVLERLIQFPCIHIVPAEEIVETVHGSAYHETEDVATPLLNEIDELEQECHQCFSPSKIEGISDSLDDISNEIKEVHKQFNEYIEELKLLSELYEKYHNAFTQVKYLSSLNVSLDDIFDCIYVNARVGKLPLDSLSRLEYYQSTPFIFKSFAEDEEYSWCMYFTTNGYERAVDNIFSALLFERIYIPDFVHGKPSEAITSLTQEMDATQEQIDKTKERENDFIHKHQDIIKRMRSELKLVQLMHQAEKYVTGLGSRFSIVGFIEEKNEDKIKKLFEGIAHVEVEILPADSDKRLKAPKKLGNKECKK